MGIFKSKPGGTFLGNIIRGAANKFSGGVLGNGAMLPQVDGSPAPHPINMEAIKGGAIDAVSGAIDKSPEVKKALIAGVWGKYKFHIIGAVVVIAGVTFYFTRRKKHGVHTSKRRF